MKNFYIKALAILLIIAVSFVFAYKAQAAFIAIIAMAVVSIVVTSITTAVIVAGLIASITLAGVVATFVCDSPLYPGGPCGDATTYVIVGSQDIGCQILLTFYNPNKNAGFIKKTVYYVSNYYVNEEIDDIDDYQRYWDANCMYRDSNGSFIKYPTLIGGRYYDLCSRVTTKTVPEYSDSANDDASKNVALYRFTTPTTVTDRQMSNWFLNNEIKIGSGYIDVAKIDKDPSNYFYSCGLMSTCFACYPERVSYDPFGQCEGATYYNGLFGSIGSESSILATVPYSDACEGNVCSFVDQSVPENSYVVYAAKIIGDFNSAERYMDLEGGYVTSPVTRANKFLNIGGGSPTLIPPPMEYAFYNQCGSYRLIYYQDHPSQQVYFGPFKTGDCPTPEFLPSVDLVSSGVVLAPNPIVLAWGSVNADSCVASGDWSGDKTTGGTEQLSEPVGEYTFTITCFGAGGEASDTEIVSVVEELPGPSPTVDLRVNGSDGPISVGYEESVELSWDSTETTSCIASGGWSGPKDVSGAESTGSLTEVTSFTLTCTGPNGTAFDSVIVNIGVLPWWKEIIPW